MIVPCAGFVKATAVRVSPFGSVSPDSTPGAVTVRVWFSVTLYDWFTAVGGNGLTVIVTVAGPDVATLRARLAITDDLPAEHLAGQNYDAAVTAAVRHFQARHGLDQTGALGPKTLAALNVPVSKRVRQLVASLDRLASLDFAFGHRYVVVNLPAAVAEAIEGDKVVRRYVVQVCKPDRPSPILTTYITTVNLNPTWTVPLGILKKDVIPKMRKDPGYAARMHMKVLDSAGN